jgi:hypothetical protein
MEIGLRSSMGRVKETDSREERGRALGKIDMRMMLLLAFGGANVLA